MPLIPLRPRPIVGLALRQTHFTLIKLRQTKRNWCVEDFACSRVPADLIVEGRMRDPAHVTYLIQQLVKTTRAEHCKTALGISAAYVINKQIQLPTYLTDQECFTELTTHLSHYLPAVHEELNIDYARTAPENTVLVAARTEQINAFVSATEQAGLSVRIVDVNSYAVARTILLHQQPSSLAQCILDLEGCSGQLMVIHQQRILFLHALVIDQASHLSAQIKQGLHLFATSHPIVLSDQIIVSGHVPTYLRSIIENELGKTLQIFNPLGALSFADLLVQHKLTDHLPELLSAFGLTQRSYPLW